MPDSVQPAFDAAATKVKDHFDKLQVTRYLACIRDVAEELRSGGMNVSLDVRPRTVGTSIGQQEKGSIVANGTLKVDDVPIEFTIETYGLDHVYLKGFANASRIISYSSYKSVSRQWTDEGSDAELAKAVRDGILQLKAENDLVNGFDTPKVTDVVTESKLTITPALKIRKGGPDGA